MDEFDWGSLGIGGDTSGWNSGGLDFSYNFDLPDLSGIMSDTDWSNLLGDTTGFELPSVDFGYNFEIPALSGITPRSFDEVAALPMNQVSALTPPGDLPVTEITAPNVTTGSTWDNAGSGVAFRPLERDYLGGTMLTAPRAGDAGLSTKTYADGLRAGVLSPTDSGMGVTLYGAPNVNDYFRIGMGGDYSNPPATGFQDYLSAYANTGARESADTFDMLASTQEGRDWLRDQGVLSDRGDLQYRLTADQASGDSFIENLSDAQKYAELYRGAVNTSALGGLSNPINAAAEVSKLVSQGVPVKIAKEIVTQKAGEQNTKLGGGTNDTSGGKTSGGTDTTKINPNVAKALLGAKALQGALGMAITLKGDKGIPRVARGSSSPVSWGSTGERQVKKLAKGGSVGQGGLGSITVALADAAQRKGLVNGADKGQADTVDARLSPGEYVMDAETVSALGDGNTQAGAAELDKMRYNIRKHKRSGGLNTIASAAKPAEKYLGKK